MQLITNYAKNDAHLRLLLQGPPGAGKTTLACQMPKAYIADCDLNLGGALRYMNEAKLTLPVGYDTIDRKDDGSDVEPNLRFERLCLCLQSAAADPNVETLVLDSATKISDYIIAHTLRMQNKKAMEMTSWGFYLGYWKELINKLSSVRKNLVLIAHEKVEKDEIDQSLKYFLLIPGQFGSMAGSLFTDVWRCEVAAGAGFGANVKYSWNVRTMPDHKFQLKNSLGLPAVFQFAWPTIAAKLAS